MKSYLQVISRALIALIFILSGVGKVLGFSAVTGVMASVGFPAPRMFLVATIALELIGGLAILVGYRTKAAAVALFLFLIPTTLIFHAAHLSDPVHGQEQFIEVLKNLAIMGALLKLTADGAGAFALERVSDRQDRNASGPQKAEAAA